MEASWLTGWRSWFPGDCCRSGCVSVNSALWTYGPKPSWYKQDGADVQNIPVTESAARSDAWLDLQGVWYRQKDNRCVGEISGHQMIWHVQWSLPCSITRLQMESPEVICYQMENQVMIGRVQREAQTILLWNDGDVWRRK
ncbi:UBP19 [Symbiodinium pilosum]|uniref:UBP19 protein n=1 Tax=Symbiodinium pilosum TaxID=2952 RepID=A0A812JKW0_SYMPI|nr:UBP19 [Symbiodinium pilosum]